MQEMTEDQKLIADELGLCGPLSYTDIDLYYDIDLPSEE